MENTTTMNQQQQQSKPSPQVEYALTALGIRFQDFKNAVDNVILAQAKEIDALKAQVAQLQQKLNAPAETPIRPA